MLFGGFVVGVVGGYIIVDCRKVVFVFLFFGGL